MEPIKDFFKYTIPNFFKSIWDFFRYDIPYGVKNIFFFWKVIWRFRPWDSSYQMRILARSLEPLAHTLEHYGNEVEGPRLKKVAKIKRAIEILNRQADSDYIELAEEKLGRSIDLSYGPFGNKPGKETKEVSKLNSEIYSLSNELEEQEFEELFRILQGQKYSQFIMLYDRAKENGSSESELWDKWFDGTGIKGWWD